MASTLPSSTNGAQKYAGMDASLMARIRELEAEYARLKKMYAEKRLKSEVIQETMVKKW